MAPHVIGQFTTDEQIVASVDGYDYKHDKTGIMYSRFGRTSDSFPYVRLGSDSTHYLELILLGFKKAITKTLDGDNITFNLKANLHIKHTIRRNTVKEEIIIGASQGTNELSFEFSLVGVTHLKVGNTIEFYDELDSNLLLFTAQKPVAVDDTDDSIEVDMSIGGGVITLTVPQVWLDSATYPVIIDPTVTTTTSTAPIWTGFKHYLHHQNGYYFVFYHNGTGPRYRSSSDGTTWGTEQTIFSTDYETYNYGIRFNGANVLATTQSGFNTRKWLHGVIHATAGTIAWSSEDTGQDGNNRGHSTPVFLDGVKVAVVAHGNNAQTDTGTRRWRGQGGISSLSAPTWSGVDETDIAFTFTQATNTPACQGFSADQEATGDFVIIGRMVNTGSLTSTDRHAIHMYYYDDSVGDFDATELVISDNTVTPNHIDTNDEHKWSAARDSNGDIHIIYLDLSGTAPAGSIVHKKITVVGPASSTIATVSTDITSLTSHVRVFLSIDLSTNDLYLFYDKGDEKIYYRKYDGSSWGSETNFKTDTTALVGAFSGFEFASNSEIGVVWGEGASSPYDVIFDKISIGGGADVRNHIIPSYMGINN